MLDESDDLVVRQRVDNDLLVELAKAYAGSKAVFEASVNFYAVDDSLDDHLDLQVVGPRQLKAIDTAEEKNDR